MVQRGLTFVNHEEVEALYSELKQIRPDFFGLFFIVNSSELRGSASSHWPLDDLGIRARLGFVAGEMSGPGISVRQAMAHELGHEFGLEDCYIADDIQPEVPSTTLITDTQILDPWVTFTLSRFDLLLEPHPTSGVCGDWPVYSLERPVGTNIMCGCVGDDLSFTDLQLAIMSQQVLQMETCSPPQVEKWQQVPIVDSAGWFEYSVYPIFDDTLEVSMVFVPFDTSTVSDWRIANYDPLSFNDGCSSGDRVTTTYLSTDRCFFIYRVAPETATTYYFGDPIEMTAGFRFIQQ